ncbi:hypothetical protein [Lutibacter profundi]|uniref:hypothetical protein n=1 Tax=Lutibacter profundi TaxID=1622118 RepID=UPI00118752F7|nr:hypothetical protein [Lutibacter profundi]
MSILKFSIPSDSEILKDINNSSNSLKFIGLGSVCQNIKETIYIRMIKFNNEDFIKKVIYKKKGIIWDFKSVEDINI